MELRKLILIPIVSAALPVAAQNSLKVDKAPAARNRILEEVVVTAQKREQNIQDVPISIQAFGGETMEALGIENTGQLGELIPSLQVTRLAGFTLIYLRGVGTDQFIPSADPSIATYVDGIYVVQAQGNTNSLANIERVEVLKGPQGTLFGRNATGGAINIITTMPSDEFEGELALEYARFDSKTARFRVSGPLTQWLSASIAGLSHKKESYFESPNFEVQPDTTRAFRGQINLRPSDAVTINLTAYYSDEDSVASNVFENTDPSVIMKAAGYQTPQDDYYSDTDWEPRGATEQWLYYGSLTWQLPRFDVKLLASDQLLEIHDQGVDFDGTPLPLVAFDTQGEYFDLKSYEIQFLSNADTWLSEKLEWVAGVYYFESDGGFDPARFHVAPQALQSIVDLAGIPELSELVGQLVDLIPLDFSPLGDQGVTLAFGGLLGTKSTSVYTQGTWTFNEYFDLTLGGRYQREERFLTKSETLFENPSTGERSAVFNFELGEETAYTFSPKAVLSYHLADDKMLYLSYAVGFKSGTYNIINIYTNPNYIEPEEVQSYELGLKADFLSGSLRFNAAVFQNEIQDLQSGFLAVLSGGAVRFLSVDEAETKGAEFDATLTPMPRSNPGLAITANGAYVKAEYLKFTNGSGFDPATGIYSEGLNFSGNDIVRSPDLTFGLGIVQAIQMAQGEIEMAVNGYYNSGFYFDPANHFEEPAYTLLSARVSYLHTPWNVRLTAFGTNLTDERYHLVGLQTDFGTQTTLGAPQEYGIRLNWQF